MTVGDMGFIPERLLMMMMICVQKFPEITSYSWFCVLNVLHSHVRPSADASASVIVFTLKKARSVTRSQLVERSALLGGGAPPPGAKPLATLN